MKVHQDGATTPVVDASVHIFFRNNQDLRAHMREPFASRGFPDVTMDWYGAPGGEYAPVVDGSDGAPGSEPDVVAAELFGRRGVDVAVLHAMSRGMLPDRRLATAVLSAHNQMLIERWLDHPEHGERFRGTLRVNPEDIPGALREIDRWADHPQIVQLGVPLQSRDPYGKPQFWPLWEKAAEKGLPVAVHIETGSGVMYPPTPSGHTRTYEQYLGFMAVNYVYHLMNMIAEGVFEKYDLKMVWADGAADFVTPFMWRMDTFGRPHLEQTPWAPRMPTDYLPGHVWFVQGMLDGPGDVPWADQWLDFTGKREMTMFGSSYPHWQLNETELLPSALTPEQRDRVLWKNAAELYGLEITAPAPA